MFCSTILSLLGDYQVWGTREIPIILYNYTYNSILIGPLTEDNLIALYRKICSEKQISGPSKNKKLHPQTAKTSTSVINVNIIFFDWDADNSKYDNTDEFLQDGLQGQM